ncbi:MAG: MFS transporter [Cyanobacteria bacterium P01_F01_bin.33]
MTASSEFDSDKLSFRTKVAYGMGDLGPPIAANLQLFFLLPFFTVVAGLPVGMAGSILAISKIWDAINDPMIGILSDKTHTRWGRRRPWILFGAIPFGLVFFAQWLVPFPGNTTALFWYYIAIAVLFNTLYTAVNLPYTALTPELTQDYDERTSLNQFRFTFSIAGSLLAGVLHPLLMDQFQDDPQRGYAIVSAMWSVAIVLPLLYCFLGTRERYQSASTTDLPLFQQIRIAFRNRAYLNLIGIYLFSWLAVQLTATIIPFYITFWMGLDNQWISFSILGVQGTAMAMLFVWNQVSARMGKRVTFAMGVSIWLLAHCALFLVQPGQLGLMLGLCVMAGMGVSVAYLIPWSMVPDIIEVDELATGERREGIFYSFMVLLQKVGLALGLFLVGQMLEIAGFISAGAGETVTEQPDSALQAIRFAIGPLPAISLILSLLCVAFYPITRERYAEVLHQLNLRKQQQNESL